MQLITRDQNLWKWNLSSSNIL